MSNEYFALDANVAALAQAFGEDMGDVKRRILKDATTFPTRTEMVAALPSLSDSPDGRIVFANGEGYMRDRDASGILDMPGWKRWEPIPGVVNASDIVSYGEQSPNPAKQAQARQNLGLGTASTHSEDDFATAEQGEKADAAVSYEAQSASEPERDQARQNLGLGSMALVDDDDVRPEFGFTVRVPSDYPTVQQALDNTRQKLLPANAEVTILIETGHELTHGWTIEGGDWSQYVIRSEDPVVRTVQTGFVPVDSSKIAASFYAIMYYENCRAPTLATNIKGWGANDYDGMMCFSGVSVEVSHNCGVQNCRINCEVRQGGCLSAQYSVWDDAVREGMRLTNGVQFSIARASFNNCWTGWDSSHSHSVGSLRITRGSFGQAQGVLIKGSGARCVTVARSYVSMIEAELESAGLESGSTTTPIQMIEGAIVAGHGSTYNGVRLVPSNIANTMEFNLTYRQAGTFYYDVPASALPVGLGGTGGTTEAEARSSLGLGSAATESMVSSLTDTTANRVPRVGFHGIGSREPPTRPDISGDIHIPCGFGRSSSSTLGRAPGSNFQGLLFVSNTTGNSAVMSFDSVNKNVYWKGMSGGDWDAVWSELLSTGNTTVDPNGFVKEASPIVKVFDGRIETNNEAGWQSIEFERVSEGVYTLSNTTGLAQNGWRVEVPQDDNGNRLLHVSLSEVDGTITLETRAPSWQEGQLVGGDLVDIPEGRWVDIRLQEVAEET